MSVLDIFRTGTLPGMTLEICQKLFCKKNSAIKGKLGTLFLVKTTCNPCQYVECVRNDISVFSFCSNWYATWVWVIYWLLGHSKNQGRKMRIQARPEAVCLLAEFMLIATRLTISPARNHAANEPAQDPHRYIGLAQSVNCPSETIPAGTSTASSSIRYPPAPRRLVAPSVASLHRSPTQGKIPQPGSLQKTRSWASPFQSCNDLIHRIF